MPIEPFTIYDEESAVDASRQMLKNTQQDFGMIPNLEGVMSVAPALLSSYVQSWDAFKQSSLSGIEQQVVYMTVNFENNCEYCVPWHTKLSMLEGMPEEEINRLRNGVGLEDKKLNALHQFTKNLVRTRGSISPADLESFFSEGYNEQQALEVVLGVAIKVMSNYTNAIAQTPLDNEVKHLAWKKPSLRSRR